MSGRSSATTSLRAGPGTSLQAACIRCFAVGVVVCRVLGELEVHTGSGPVDLGGPLPRRLVCMLLLADGQVVSDERLCHVIWGQRAEPSKAVASLQAYVSRVRRVLDDRDGWQVQRVGAGYRLLRAAGVTDVDRFVACVHEGRQSLATGRPAEALPVLDEALALWRGVPFADLPDDPQVTAARARLAELREVAVEERLAAHLDAGDAPTAVAELEPAVHDTPFRERRWALLVTGLYRCGRQQEALAVLRQVRQLLADELGIDPGPELQQLERRVLAQDPHLLDMQVILVHLQRVDAGRSGREVPVCPGAICVCVGRGP